MPTKISLQNENFIYRASHLLQCMNMTKNGKQDRLDKRAAALRDNLKRRKLKAKADKAEKPESNKNKESNDGTSETTK